MMPEERFVGGVVDIEFTADDVARTRFAVSPLWEVVASVRVLMGADEQGLHRVWTHQALDRIAAAKLRIPMLTSLVEVPTLSIPGFLAAPPTTAHPTLDLELAALRATPPELVRTSPLGPVRAVAAMRKDPARSLAMLAEEIEAYWEVAMAPFWPRVQTLAEADVRYRAKRFAEGGAQRLFADLSPDVSWHGDTLHLRHRFTSGRKTLGGRGLLLVPSVFVVPEVFVTLGYDEPLPTLRYPPRGDVGNQAWQPRPEPGSAALARILGRGRANILAELGAPACTADLARRLGKTPGAISQHLGAMRAAGLVSAHRSGRIVLYARTRVAEALFERPGE
ncbi:DUF5937 family protein [Uniformispora flossi]|uniref:ArsR/SmtB family transcription factor n=1 Tax=Uniformispora flossi TaxID=3390723 RepID=UPI003C2EBA8E